MLLLRSFTSREKENATTTLLILRWFCFYLMKKQIVEYSEDGRSVKIINPDDSWIRIPRKWQESLTDLTPAERYVLITLKSYKGIAGLIYPSLRELSKSTGYSLKGIEKIIKRLENKKKIIITKRKGTSNAYRIIK